MIPVTPMRLLGIGTMLKMLAGSFLLLLKTAYALLKRLKMRFFSLYLLVAVLLVQIGAVKEKSSVYYGLIVAGILLFLISLSAFSRALNEKEGNPVRKKKPKGKAETPQAVSLPQGNFVLTPVDQNGNPVYPVAPAPVYTAPTNQYAPMAPKERFEPRTEALPPPEAPPTYYRVAQNPKYVMAEYADRVELYYETPRGLKYVRTDYKTRG